MNSHLLKRSTMINENFYRKVKFKFTSFSSPLFLITFILSHLHIYKATITSTTSITSLVDEQLLFISAEEALESYEKNNLHNNNSYNTNLAVKDCSSLFPRCLCSFKESTRRNFLYCNDPAVKRIPDFKVIYKLFESYVQAVHSNLNLIFSKVDFTSKL